MESEQDLCNVHNKITSDHYPFTQLSGSFSMIVITR